MLNAVRKILRGGVPGGSNSRTTPSKILLLGSMYSRTSSVQASLGWVSSRMMRRDIHSGRLGWRNLGGGNGWVPASFAAGGVLGVQLKGGSGSFGSTQAAFLTASMYSRSLSRK